MNVLCIRNYFVGKKSFAFHLVLVSQERRVGATTRKKFLGHDSPTYGRNKLIIHRKRASLSPFASLRPICLLRRSPSAIGGAGGVNIDIAPPMCYPRLARVALRRSSPK